ncbi:coagulation factor XIII B chain [Pelobates fuscus]|uniref:coagulation factor XIII B chain n=1 Tax=Pelobates fuscus TaxID=191477 RepID=UPI002FE45452
MASYIFWLLLLCSVCCNSKGESCDLPNVENGKIAQYFYIFKKFYFPMEVGKKLSVACTAGYTSQSGKQEETITCTLQGWEPEPICFKKCMKPSLENGVVFNAKELYKTLEKAQYECLDGYTTSSGNKTEEIVCSSTGWTPQPQCHQISDRCEAPLLANGHYASLKNIFGVKDVLEFKCDEGYRTASGRTADRVECLLRGWSSVPQCTQLICEKLSPVGNGGFYPLKASYADKDVVQFFCRENYILKGSELIQCYSFGWYPNPPICEERRNRCPPPPRPSHTIILTNLTRHGNGDIVRYECDQKYKLIGSEEVKCENGLWTNPPSCVELKGIMKCGKPPPIENGDIINDLETYYSGDMVNYQCTHGYRINGMNKIICKLGKWPEPPTCVVSDEYCPMPPSIKNGEPFDIPSANYSVGSSVEYMCHSYHLMEGSKTITCLGGSWSQLPTCLEPCTVTVTQMRQRNIELRWSFEINSPFMHGELVDFKCIEGFDMLHSSGLKVLCQRGQLQYPSCSKRDNVKVCGSPPIVRYSEVNVAQESYVSGSSVIYSCLEFYFLKGSRTVHCSNGEWESPPTCIEPCILSKEEMERKHIKLRWSLDNNGKFYHGEFVEFVCKEGYRNIQAIAMFSLRSQCNNGKLIYPECEQR